MKIEKKVRKKLARQYDFVPHQHDTELHEAWNFFVILLYGNTGSLDAVDDTVDCKKGFIF